MFNNRPGQNSGKPFPPKGTGSGMNKPPMGTKPGQPGGPTGGDSVNDGLENLQFVLEYMEFETAHIPVDAENKIEQLFVSLAALEDEFTDDSPFAQIMFINDMIAPLSETNPDFKNSTYILQFFVSMGINVPPEKHPEIHQLLSALSNITPIGHLAFNSETGVFFRYSLVLNKREVEPEVAIEVVEMIRFFILTFSYWIKEFCKGVVNFEEVMESVEKDLGKPRV